MQLEPYFEQDDIVIYHGDMIDIAPLLEVDMILADPPYGETTLAWDTWPTSWPAAARQALTPNGSMWCFGTFKMFWNRKEEFEHWRVVQDIIWEKHNGSGFLVDRFRRVHEQPVHFVLKESKWEKVYTKTQYTMDAKKKTVRRKDKPKHLHGDRGDVLYQSYEGGPRLMRSVIRCRSMNGRARNATQKPVGILSPLIRYSCKPGGVVLAPFCGSGSTLFAARALGKKAIGIDIREKQCEIAADRLSQSELFTKRG